MLSRIFEKSVLKVGAVSGGKRKREILSVVKHKDKIMMEILEIKIVFKS